MTPSRQIMTSDIDDEENKRNKNEKERYETRGISNSGSDGESVLFDRERERNCPLLCPDVSCSRRQMSHSVPLGVSDKVKNHFLLQANLSGNGLNYFRYSAVNF